jgi:hypothetical protein
MDGGTQESQRSVGAQSRAPLRIRTASAGSTASQPKTWRFFGGPNVVGEVRMTGAIVDGNGGHRAKTAEILSLAVVCPI